MAEYSRIKISGIHVGERTRPVDEDHAQAIAASISERGLINPITVRKTPAMNKGATPYTLVAGGHRLRAGVILGWEEIDVIIVAADQVEAQLIEISENLYRNELSKLDRAIFVQKFREMWEEKHGKIERGGDRRSKGNDCPLIFATGRELSEHVSRRLGFSERTYKYVTQIGQNLHPGLRAALRGTPAADDQSLLLKLAKKGPTEQAAIANAMQKEPDIRKVLSWSRPPKAKPDEAAIQAALLATLQKAWKDADDDTRERFLITIGIVEDLREAAE